MNWDAIGAVAEMFSALVVLVSVLYLVIQIRQNTNQTRLGTIQAINSSNDSAFDPIYIPENSIIFAKGQAQYPDLSDHEAMVFDMLMARLIGSLDASTYQYEQGAYDEELYFKLVGFYANFLSSPGGAAWFKLKKAIFSNSMKKNLEAAIREASAGGA